MDDVRTHGAVGDGRTLDHAAFQRAINQCSVRGGGIVVVPPGRYRCGSIKLKGGVHLHIQAGAEIFGSPDEADYECVVPSCHGVFPTTTRALFHADEEDDIAITGYGSIHGGGDSPMPGPLYLATCFRPAVFLLRGCCRVRIADLTIKDSRYWTIHLLRCCDVRVRGITISNHRQRISSVGLVADSSRDVLVSDCVIESGDDAVAVKSTVDLPCSNIAVTNCILRSSQAALKIGAQSVGTISNVLFSNCIIEGSHVGIGVYMKDGGLFENLSFIDLVISADSEFPITIDATARRHARDTDPGHMRDLRFSGLTVHGRGRCYVQGHPLAPIERLTMRDVVWTVHGYCDGPKAVKNRGSEHVDPQPGGVDLAAEPWHFVFAHIAGLRMADISCHLAVPLQRHDRGLLLLDHVSDAAFADLRGLPTPPGLPAVEVRGCSDLHGLSSALRTGAAVVSGLESGLMHAAVRGA